MKMGVCSVFCVFTYGAGIAVSILTELGLDDRSLIPGMDSEGILCLCHGVQTDCWAHQVFCPIGIGLFSSGGKAVGA
jgi:hypothetical protein